MQQLWHCTIANLKQRTRQQSYMVTLFLMAILTLLFFPSPDAQYQTLVVNGYRGIYNSAWIGISLAMLNVFLLPLVCFFLVKSALAMDRQLMTGELIAATPVSKLSFLFCKWVTNCLILFSLILVMLISSVFVQLYYGESYQIDFWALLWPQLVFVLPTLVAIAAIALMFESIRWLQGGLGNIVYFFLWVGSIVKSVEGMSGIGAVLDKLDADVLAQFPEAPSITNIGVSINESYQVKTFIWQGLQPTLAHVVGTAPMLLITLVCLAGAYLFFDRFSHVQLDKSTQNSRVASFINEKLLAPSDKVFAYFTKHFAFTRFLRMEFKLLAKGHSKYWIIGFVGLSIAQLFVEKFILLSIILPIAWLWCILVISQLGQMENQANTTEIVAYSRRTISTQVLASHGAAFLLLLLVSAGGVIRFILAGEWLLLIQLVIALAFTVSLAYLCGALTGNKRLFEVLYLAFWYIGPMQNAPYADFFGANNESSWQTGIPLYFAACSLILVALSISKRAKVYI